MTRGLEADRFPDEVVAAVAGHMNADHAGDALLIARAFGGVPDATAARVADLDKAGMDLEVVVGGASRTVRVPWAQRLEERPQLRPELARLYREACAALGVPARDAAEH